MLPEKLVDELQKLNRADKLRVIQLLANQLADEDETFFQVTQYEIWSPYDAAGAAHTLMQMLE
mgnify:CR=1 FL=1